MRCWASCCPASAIQRNKRAGQVCLKCQSSLSEVALQSQQSTTSTIVTHMSFTRLNQKAAQTGMMVQHFPAFNCGQGKHFHLQR